MSLPENIIERPLEEVLPEAFLGYSKFVIRHRAIPDVRDGLKPVHRRIIYTMYELGMTHDKPYSKSARMVGDCMAKFHPHGDSAIYDAGVRMAQVWASRYLFIDGHGNYGSIDGDPAAAMRYTEMRMTPLAELMCQDLEKNTVKMVPNYDNKLEEPAVLPSPVPNVLLNGTSGIAVGMSSNMPPHNLREVVSGILKQIDNPDISTEELLRYVPGPDFPTGGYIIGTDGIKEAYRTGRGKIAMRAKAAIEPGKNAKNLIVVTEIPYQVNKANLAAKIEQLSEEKIEGISDVRDESDREGMRLVIECRKEADPQKILQQLYKFSSLQENFNVINLVINAEGSPQEMGLKAINAAFIEHRREVVTRRTEYDLAKAKARAHILEGLVIAINNLDEVIALIRASKSPSIAKAGLITRFELSEIQAQAILDMKLQHLTNMELAAIKKEYQDILKLIAALEEILADVSKVYALIKKELKEIADKYGDNRRTVILPEDVGDIVDASVFEEPEKAMEVILTWNGFVKQVPVQKRKANALAYSFKDGDILSERLVGTDKDTLYFFTQNGRFYSVAAKIIPEAGGKEKGRAITNLLPLPENEWIISTVPVKEMNESLCFVFVTREGQVMRTPVSDFIHARTPEAITLKEGDELIKVFVSDGSAHLFLASAKGQCIRFAEAEVSTMGRKSRGVKGFTLENQDAVVDALLISHTEAGTEDDLITVTERGFVKRSSLTEYKPQGRGGKGIAIAKIDPRKTGWVVAIARVNQDNTLVVIQKNGQETLLEVKNLQVESRAKAGAAMIPVLLDDFCVKLIGL